MLMKARLRTSGRDNNFADVIDENLHCELLHVRIAEKEAANDKDEKSRRRTWKSEVEVEVTRIAAPTL